MKRKTLLWKDLSRVTKGVLNDAVWMVPPFGAWRITHLKISIERKDKGAAK